MIISFFTGIMQNTIVLTKLKLNKTIPVFDENLPTNSFSPHQKCSFSLLFVFTVYTVQPNFGV